MRAGKVVFLLTILLLTNIGKMSAQIVDMNYLNPKTYIIKEIKFVGNTTNRSSYLKAITGLQEGDEIQIPGDAITNAVKKIWKQRLVDDIQIETIKRDGIYVTLLFRVKEVRTFSVAVINGQKGDEAYKEITKSARDDIKEFIPVYSGEKITQADCQNVKTAVERYFKDEGFCFPKVEVYREDDPTLENKVRLIINIDKGEKVKIEKINFSGVRAAEKSKLLKRLKKTKRKKWYAIFRRSKFIESDFKNDLKSVIALYNSMGYRDAKVVNMTPQPKKVDEKLVNLDIKIDEGRKYYFRNITWQGNFVYDNKTLNKILKIKKGDVYNNSLLDTRLNYNPSGPDVSSLYLDDGYLFFSVKPVEVRVEGDSIDVEMRMFEGTQARIKNVTVTGNTKTSDHVILREIRTLPGDKFSRANLIRSQREIAALGYFDPEQIQILPQPNPNDGTVDIEYKVVEKPSDQLQLSGGWGGIVGFVGTLGLVFNNFSIRNIGNFKTWSPLPSGDGQRLSIRFQANGPQFQTYSLSFTEPWLGGKKPKAFTVSLTHSVNNSIDNDFNRTGWLRVSGATLSLARRIPWPDNFFTWSNSLSFLHYDIFNSFSSALCDTCVSNNISFTNTFARDNRGNNPNFYTSGSLVRLTTIMTLPYSKWFDRNIENLGEPEKFKWTEYHKWYFDNEWYFQLTGWKKQKGGIGITDTKTRHPLVLQARAHFGMIAAYNQKLGVGPFERFILGGDGLSGAGFSTFILGSDIIGLRGYQNNSIDPTGSGGVLFNKFVTELRYPLVTEGVATIFILGFAEAGNNWDSFKNYNPFRLMRSVGFGVRIFMPAFGMIGVDYGRGLDVVPGCATCNQGQFHFTIGQQIR